MKKFTTLLISIILICIICCYLFLIYAIPAFVNSPRFEHLIENVAANKFGVNIQVENIHLHISPKLHSNLQIQTLKIISKNNKVALDLINFASSITGTHIDSVVADKVSVNLDELLGYFPAKKTKKKEFKVQNIPDLKIKNLQISKNNNVQFVFRANDVEILNDKINLKARYQMDRIINPVYLGEAGELYKRGNDLIANNYSITIGNAHFYLNGKILKNGKLGEMSLESKDIEAGELMKTLLFLQKFTDPTKKFIENFRNYKGLGYIKLEYKDKNLTGYAKLTNVSANTVLFGIPLKVPFTEFFIKNNEVTEFATGFAGKEVITHKLHMVNIMSKDRIAYGEVKTILTDRLIKEYLPEKYRLKNKIDLTIDYSIQHRKVTVKYTAKIPKETSIIMGNYYSGIEDRKRLITAETYKDGIKLYLKNYHYSVEEKNAYKDILSGDGFFINDNGRMFPKFINCMTNGYVPNSFTGSFGNYVSGGKFNGILHYDVPQKQITGKFEVIDTIFNDFNVKKAIVIADKKLMSVVATGTFRGEKFNCKGEAKNDFREKIYVNNMDLFLDKFIIKKKAKTSKKLSFEEKREKIQDFDNQSIELGKKVRKIHMDIEKWNISGNLFQIGNAKLEDVVLNGYMKNGIFKYNIPKVIFANGILSAKGTYDYNIFKSVIDFSAKNIDSNIIATEVFGISNQIKGIANATLHAETSKNLSNGIAYATFEIDNGALPQLENFEFRVDKKGPDEKAKISDYVKFNATKKGNLQSKLKGSFKCNTTCLYDADIRLQHEFLSFLVTGKYNYITGDEVVSLFGKYDNSVTKKTKIIHIPLNWVINVLVPIEHSKNKYTDQINKIPPIGVDDKKAKYFYIKANGNAVSNKYKVIYKVIK